MKVSLLVLAGALALAGCKGCGGKKVSEELGEKHEGHAHGDEKEEGKDKEHAGEAGEDKHDHGGGKEHGGEKEHAGEKHEGEEKGHGDHEELITLTPEAMKSANIQLGEARQKGVSGELSASARLTLTQKGSAKIAARVPGRVASIDVQLGQKVQKGQVLGYLESSELGKTRADFLAASTKARVAEANFRREKELVAKGISAEREMREAESTFAGAQAEMNAAEAGLHSLGLSEADIKALKGDAHYSSRFPARSPIEGIVLEVSATVGQAVEGTTPLFAVGQLGELWALIDIFEAQLRSVQVGQQVELTVGAVSGVFKGRVDYIGDLVDEKSRSVSVRVVVPNPDAKLKPGMFATARLLTGAQVDGGSDTSKVVVPREAVQKIGNEQVVFVPKGDNQFKPVAVKVGSSSAGEVEITEGLSGGERVVTQGAFILKSELSKESMGEGHSH